MQAPAKSWKEIAATCPRLRNDLRWHPGQDEDGGWVLEDPLSRRYHRLSPLAAACLRRMDGRHSLEAIRLAVRTPEGVPPPPGFMVQLLHLLETSDLLLPEGTTAARRARESRRQERKRRWSNPLAIRIPLIDPEPWLERATPWLRKLCSPAGFLAWAALVLPSLAAAAMHWPELSAGARLDRLFNAQNLLLVWLIYPPLKLLHELAHAAMVKRFGGEVHEMGILLVGFLLPVPYVDASSSAAFRERRQRMLVAAAGILAELLAAALALWLWLAAEPGLVRAATYDLLLVVGASTLLINANPLMRYDGYYLFMELVRIPNLGGRANQYLRWLLKRLLGARVPSPARSARERRWFLLYGPAALLYRLWLVLAILGLVLERLPWVGLPLAAWAGASLLLAPLVRGLDWLAKSPEPGPRRRRAVALACGSLATLTAAVFLLPLPLHTRTEGVVWLPDEARVRAGTDCFVTDLPVPSGARVEAGQLILGCSDPLLAARVRLLEGRQRELELRRRAKRQEDPYAAQLVAEELESVAAALDEARRALAALEIRAPLAGRLYLPRATDLPGRFLKRGELAAWILPEEGLHIRAVVPQDAGPVAPGQVLAAEVKPLAAPALSLPASLADLRPAGGRALPSAALGRKGGGRLEVDPADPEGRTPLVPVFQFDLEVPTQSLKELPLGSRVLIRLEHPPEPLARRWYRGFRSLFLERFDT